MELFRKKKKKVWFRPAHFWGYFAFYYPSSPAGWGVSIFLLAFLVMIFLFIDQSSHSGSDTIIAFAPWAIAVMALFDILCFRRGEYPNWWKKY